VRWYDTRSTQCETTLMDRGHWPKSIREVWFSRKWEVVSSFRESAFFRPGLKRLSLAEIAWPLAILTWYHVHTDRSIDPTTSFSRHGDGSELCSNSRCSRTVYQWMSESLRSELGGGIFPATRDQVDPRFDRVRTSFSRTRAVRVFGELFEFFQSAIQHCPKIQG
jgi:hypothetical protein